MEFREATKADIVAIAQLHAESWQSAYRGIMRDEFLDYEVFDERQKVWQERFDVPTGNQFILLAVEYNEIKGFVCVFGNNDERYGSLVDNLHVLPSVKGKGVGTRLLMKAQAWINLNYPDEGMFLWVYEKNINARKFYEKLGGKSVESVMHKGTDGTTAEVLRYVWENRYAK